MGKKTKSKAKGGKATGAKAASPLDGLRAAMQPNMNLLSGKPPTQQDLEARKQVVERLSKAFKALSDPPEPILSLFDRLGLKYQITGLGVDNERDSNTIVTIKYQDLLAAEEVNQKQGSIVTRLYPNATQPDSTQPDSTQPDSTPLTQPEPTPDPTPEPTPDPTQPGSETDEEYDLRKVQG